MRQTAVRLVPFREPEDGEGGGASTFFLCGLWKLECIANANEWYEEKIDELDEWWAEEMGRIESELALCMIYALDDEDRQEDCRTDAFNERLAAEAIYAALVIAYGLIYEVRIALCELVYKACCLFDPLCFFP